MYLSRFLKLKICGGKHSACSIVVSPNQQLGWGIERGPGGPNSSDQGVILVTEHNAEVNAGFTAPITLHRFGRKTGSAYHSTVANPKSRFFANALKGLLLLIGRWSLQWFQMDGMTET